MSRVVRNAFWILGLLALAGLLGWGWGAAASVLIGGAAAVLNFRWTTVAVDRLLGSGKAPSAGLAAAKYAGRLLLIFTTLFAMIQIPFLSLLGGVAGLSIFVLAGMWEAVLLLAGEFKADR